MFRIKDILLLTVIVLSGLLAIYFPDMCSIFQPYLTLFIMMFLFLSFLSISLKHLGETIKGHWRHLMLLSVLKVVLLPIAAYWLFLLVLPDFAIGALLLGGVSSGVVAPFMAGCVGGNIALVLLMVIVTSLITPFTLPLLIDMLVSRSVEFPVRDMILMLAQIIFIPMAAAEFFRFVWAKGAEKVRANSYPINLALFAMLNLGVFSKYSEYFFRQPLVILSAVGASVLLAVFAAILGLGAMARSELSEQIAASVSMVNVNNVLVIVFSSRFFGPLEPTMATMYMVPFFGILLPLRIYQTWQSRRMSRQPLV